MAKKAKKHKHEKSKHRSKRTPLEKAQDKVARRERRLAEARKELDEILANGGEKKPEGAPIS